ncbi:PREDICTED: mucin-13, partial [Hipposideros armiger]|uniref:Mucin-13 n=1 Tax=Hipposideros armiger TaxID=186990 RepID=A0A8B7S4A2_HIPAR
TPSTATTTASPVTPTTPTPSTTPIAATPTTDVSSVTSNHVTSSKTSSPTPESKGPCQKYSCSDGSSCVDLNKTHICLCIDGYYYNSSKCNKGKTFPGIITVTVTDTTDLKNTMSKAYEELHTKVIGFFQDVFVNLDYGQTVIHNVRIPPSARSEMRADGKDVSVTVVNLFAENTAENEMTVSRAIEKAINSSSSVITGYVEQNRCDFYGCVNDMQDNCTNGFLCQCKNGLERPNPQTPVCLEFQLILVIVGTIAGVLILGMAIALIIVRSKKQKDDEEQNLIENDFQNLRLQQQTTGFINPGAEGSLFPKVRANFSRDHQLQNPYVNQRGMPRPDY